MNKKEIRTVNQEAQRFMKDTKLVLVEEVDSVKLELSFSDPKSQALYLFVAKRKGEKTFSLMLPVESVGMIAVDETLVRLQPLLKTYGLILTQEAVIIEENTKLPLHKRIRNMSQALVAVDGIRRLWKVEFDRRTEANAIESKNTKPTSNTSNDSSFR